MELDENFEISPCALQERRSTSELIQRLVPRLSGAPAHFCFLDFFALGSFGQVRLPLRDPLFHQNGIRTRNAHPTPPGAALPVELSGVGGKRYLYTAPLPVTAVALRPCQTTSIADSNGSFALTARVLSTALQEGICRRLAEI